MKIADEKGGEKHEQEGACHGKKEKQGRGFDQQQMADQRKKQSCPARKAECDGWRIENAFQKKLVSEGTDDFLYIHTILSDAERPMILYNDRILHT